LGISRKRRATFWYMPWFAFASADSAQFLADNSSKDLFDGIVPMRDVLPEGIVE
jgi:hypothetical protein